MGTGRACLIVVGGVELFVLLAIATFVPVWESPLTSPCRSAHGSTPARRVYGAPTSALAGPRRPRLADGCQHVYLDVGTNIGVQIRKLFEPQHYPNAKILPIFDQAFGTDRTRTVCAFGWEANPSHTPRLREVQAAYRRVGWRTTIHVETAAGVRDGSVPFFWSGNSFHDLAASTMPSEHLTSSGVEVHRTDTRMMDLARFIKEEVHERLRPDGVGPGAVVMKVDVEGAELDLLPDLMLRGALCDVHTLYVEFHQNPMKKQPPRVNQRYLQMVHFLSGALRGKNASKPLDSDCPVVLATIDDETYANDNGFSERKADRWMRHNKTGARAMGFKLVRPPLPSVTAP
jgi:hypothetical protein